MIPRAEGGAGASLGVPHAPSALVLAVPWSLVLPVLVIPVDQSQAGGPLDDEAGGLAGSVGVWAESARGAVLGLPPVRFPGPLAEPAVRVSSTFCRNLARKSRSSPNSAG